MSEETFHWILLIGQVIIIVLLLVPYARTRR
jgi:hypothetical protein